MHPHKLLCTYPDGTSGSQSKSIAPQRKQFSANNRPSCQGKKLLNLPRLLTSCQQEVSSRFNVLWSRPVKFHVTSALQFVKYLCLKLEISLRRRPQSGGF
ncbi:hypothetical protein JRQ81_010813 [Phrynocephalus forsythii]|uniref:Uncharacterized protein n=1 Tax=Phrynocephalus forsythii TaxID=171643 RepID=A0A9Q0X764_9SAUR|nr:hypothetical protein JRQ81_010813 [Phrynocephalus forsythii]